MAVEVKICGLTRAADAAVAVAAGASYLGVVYAGGPRRVDDRTAAAIVAAAAGRPVLGVFGSESVEAVLRVRDATGVAGAQLHGGSSAAVATRLKDEGMLVWRVVRLAGPADVTAVPGSAAGADAVLVEAMVPGRLGGTGVSLALDLAQAARAALAGRRLVLAGGLTPATVARAVALVGPDIVDVSSGVEREPGIKDPDLIHHFLEAAVGRHPTA